MSSQVTSRQIFTIKEVASYVGVHLNTIQKAPAPDGTAEGARGPCASRACPDSEGLGSSV